MKNMPAVPVWQIDGPKSARTFTLYCDSDGTPVSDGRQSPRAYHTYSDAWRQPLTYAPLDPDFVVRARSVQQARAFVADSTTSSDRTDGLGIWWTLEDDEGTLPPLGKDMRPVWATIAACRTLTVATHGDKEAAEKVFERINRSGCGGACRRNHELRQIAWAQVERVRPDWVA